MKQYDCVGSIVAYNNPPEMILRSAKSVLDSQLNVKLYIIDNSPTPALQPVLEKLPVHYHYANANLGFGKAHNWAIEQNDATDYHMVLNPDIHFGPGTIEALKGFMDENHDIGLIMPKILNMDDSIQYLCKLLPTPADLIGRRFMQTRRRSNKKNMNYELRFSGYDKIMDVPCLSGCFMFLRKKALETAGLFDERYFMYLEDVDLCRRINKFYKTTYYPDVTVYHEYKKESYKSNKVLWHHLNSAVKYFNKWGWFFDKERDVINSKSLKMLIHNE